MFIKVFGWQQCVLNTIKAKLHSPLLLGCGWNEQNFSRSWDDGLQTIDSYKRRLKAAFELYSKLGKNLCFMNREPTVQ